MDFDFDRAHTVKLWDKARGFVGDISRNAGKLGEHEHSQTFVYYSRRVVAR